MISSFEKWMLVLACLALSGCVSTSQIKASGTRLALVAPHHVPPRTAPQPISSCYKKISCYTIRKIKIFKAKCKSFKLACKQRLDILERQATIKRSALNKKGRVKQKSCREAFLKARPRARSLVLPVALAGAVGLIAGAVGSSILILSLR